MTKTRTAARLVAQWRASEGESAASFAPRDGLSWWACCYWQRKLSASQVPAPVGS